MIRGWESDLRRERVNFSSVCFSNEREGVRGVLREMMRFSKWINGGVPGRESRGTDGKQSTHGEQDNGPRLQHDTDGLPGLLGTEVPAPPSSFSRPHKPPASDQSSQIEIRWAQGKGSLMNIHLSKVSTGCICADGIEGYISCSGGGKFSYGNAVFNLLIKLRLSARGSRVFLLQCQGEIYKFLKVIWLQMASEIWAGLSAGCENDCAFNCSPAWWVHHRQINRI